MDTTKKVKIPKQTTTQEEVIITPPPVIEKEKATRIEHDIVFQLLNLNDYLLDPRIGHLDWTPPNPADTKLPNNLSRNPFGQLVSFFIYKPYLEMDGGSYNVNYDMSIGNARETLDTRPGFGRLDRKVMGDAKISLVPVPIRISQYNPLTGLQENIYQYVDKNLTISNEFSNSLSKISSQVYNESANQSIKEGVNKYKEDQFLAPKISNIEASAILTGMYQKQDTPDNITACPATKMAIRNSSEYQRGDIKEYILMTVGDETLVDTYTNETRVIKERDNQRLIAVDYIQSFSLAMGNTAEAKEHNKGYLVINQEVILARKSHISQVTQKTIVNNTQAEYGATDETIRRALAAYNKKN